MAEPRNFDLHKEEYGHLKKEIEGLVAGTTANLQYAIALSGGIFAWVLVTARTAVDFSNFPANAAWFLPAALTIAFAVATCAMYLRIGQMGDYLLKLEEAYADDDLGWERHFRRQPTVFLYVYGAAWVALIVGDFLFGWIAFGAAKPPPPPAPE